MRVIDPATIREYGGQRPLRRSSLGNQISGHLWREVEIKSVYAAGVSCLASNSTGVIRPKSSISTITLPDLVIS
jgi:hypothetical protein